MVFPTFGAEVVDSTVYLSDSSQISDYQQISNKVLFVATKSLEYTPDSYSGWNESSPLISGGSFEFTSDEKNDAAAYDLIISKGYRVFQDTICTLDEMGTVSISQNNASKSVNYRLNEDYLSANASSYGAVLYRGNFCAFHNDSVAIESNKVSAIATHTSGGASATAAGGAIFSDVFQLEDNKLIHIDNNEAYAQSKGSNGTSGSVQGGAVRSQTIYVIKNVDLSFSGNRATATTADTPVNQAGLTAVGGAVYSSGEIIVRGNSGGEITIADNAAEVYSEISGNIRATSTGKGGAVFAGGSISFDSNSDINIRNNYVVAEAHAGYVKPYRTEAQSGAYGGVIYATGDLSIQNNDDVSFSGNHADAYARAVLSGSTTHENVVVDAVAQGGVIYAQNSVCITGNHTVTFEENYEVTKKGDESYTYRLRSIYMIPDTADDTLVLGAKTNGHITFYDSVYMGNYTDAEVSLNVDYADADGVTQKATGDIVFSGKYTEEHLKEVKGSDGTKSEIANSRTSELLNTVNLYGGKLRVEDKAVLKTHDINVTAGSKATLNVSNATVDASGYNISINNTGKLQLEGRITDSVAQAALLNANNITISNGAELEVKAITTNTPVQNLSAAFTMDTIPATGYDASRAYNILAGGKIDAALLTLAAGSTFTANASNVALSNGELTLDITSTASKRIELNLTLSADYDPTAQVVLFSDVATVNFIKDGLTAKSTDGVVYTLSAGDYFSGVRITDATTLVYDSTNKVVYLEGVANVPEPTSSMLGLMGLVAFTLRRRRK